MSKGSNRRPPAVDRATVEANWARTFTGPSVRTALRADGSAWDVSIPGVAHTAAFPARPDLTPGAPAFERQVAAKVTAIRDA